MITTGITEHKPPNAAVGAGTAWVSEARNLAGQWADAEGFPAEVIEDVRLVASELVANAVEHAAGSEGVLLRLYRCDVGATVEVWDALGAKRPKVMVPDLLNESGRGMAIVEALSYKWDVNPLANGGKAVWAVIEGGE
ncbi:ATP-binding protein [Actinomadura flavalba]|uniref:ATP-binding protein n=1 Tax=Actinomadura flavalba TaxID=1120938 RepID=UPI0012DF28F5|nr:ATP-binding protein [Actinomadura flavalba]